MKIECIADHPEMMDTLAKWHESEWGSEWAQQVRELTCRGEIPTIYIATEGDELLGSCMLVSIDMTGGLKSEVQLQHARSVTAMRIPHVPF